MRPHLRWQRSNVTFSKKHKAESLQIQNAEISEPGMCVFDVLASHTGLCAVSVNPYAKMVLGPLSTLYQKKKKKPRRGHYLYIS